MKRAQFRDALKFLQSGAPAVVMAGIAAALVSIAVLAFATRQGGSVGVHLFYAPTIVAAARFGTPGGVAVGALSGFLAGAAVPDATIGSIVGQAIGFLVAGTLVGLLRAERIEALQRQEDIARRESEMRDRSAAIVQLMSHELRTPLTVIRGGFQTFQAHGQLDEYLEPLAQAVDRACQRLDRMLDIVLAASDEFGKERSGPTTLDVPRLLAQVAASFSAPERQRIRVAAMGRTTEIVAEEWSLRLLLRAVVDNALKFSPEGTPIELTAVLGVDEVTFRVVDEGPGLPASFRQAAFEPFTQADTSTVRRHPGLGLGLYTVRRLATRLGGGVQLHDAPTGGLAVVVQLPHQPGGRARERSDDRATVADTRSSARAGTEARSEVERAAVQLHPRQA